MQAIEFFVENKTLFTIVHVLSVIIGMGAAIVSDLLFNFYSADKKLDKKEARTLEFLSSVVWISLLFIIISGFGLFFSDPPKYLVSNKFISKMSIMVVLLANGVFLSKFISPHFSDTGLLKFKKTRTLRQIAFVSGAISISSWFIVCILGLLQTIPFHFSEFLAGYVTFIFAAGIIALIVEKKTFN